MGKHTSRKWLGRPVPSGVEEPILKIPIIAIGVGRKS